MCLAAHLATMKFSIVTTLLPLLASAAYFAQEEYESGAVMDRMMERKEVRLIISTLMAGTDSCFR